MEVRTVLTPAQLLIQACKGVNACARAFGRTPGAVSNWSKPRAQKGCDGFLPGDIQRRALVMVEAGELKLSVRDLIVGREVPCST